MGSINKLDKRYIVITVFILLFVISVTTQSFYLNLISAPLMIILIILAFRNELQVINFNKLFFNKTIYEKILNGIVITIIGQGLMNTVSFYLFSRTTKASETVLAALPVIPLYTVLFAPIVEEVIFRYIIFGYIQNRSKKFSILAAISSSILFAAGHLSLSLFLGYFFVGLVLCHYYYKTETLYTSILIHIILNFIVLFYQSAHLI